jgi:hypothetical protein
MAGVQPVIKRCRAFTATTLGFAVAPWYHFNLNVHLSIALNEPILRVDKRLEFVTLIQDSL